MFSYKKTTKKYIKLKKYLEIYHLYDVENHITDHDK